MRGSPEERAAVRKSYYKMNKKEKAEYILTYYKLPLFTAFVVLAVGITSLVHTLTKKEPVLYTAYVNTVFGDDMTQKMTDDFLNDIGLDLKRNEVLVYKDLYIDEDPTLEDHQYVYASKMKILGAISAKQMDVALMNDNAYGQMSASGLLMEMDTVLKDDTQLYEDLKPYLTEGTVILEDNSVEYSLNEADTYEAVTEQQINAIDVSEFPIFRSAEIDGKMYLGVIGNTPRVEKVRAFLAYLLNTK
ncbi:MAG: hypothetical protein IJI75_12010 [Solobacterium sp.]|nr:hypothetical protein [Solobacterium sp.]